MCDSIANGGPRFFASSGGGSCPPANVIIASNVLDTTGNVIAGNIISVDGTFTGNLYVAGNLYADMLYSSLNVGGFINTETIISGAYFGNGYGLSNLNASNLTGTILNTNFPPSGVTAGTYGSSANVSQVTIDQYGLVTTASNIGILSSQWTTVDGNVAYQNGVSIGTLSAPPIGSNLYVIGNANIESINTTTLNAASIFGTNFNVTGTSNLSTTNVTTLNASSIFGTNFNVTGTSNLSTTNVTTLNASSIFGTNLNVTGTSNLSTTNVTTLNASSIFGTNLNVTGNIYASNALQTTNVVTSNINVSTTANIANLVVTSNILAGPAGNTYLTGNLVVSGNVFSSLGTPLGSGGSLYFSLGGTLTPSTFTGVVYGQTLALSLSTFSIQGTSTDVSRTANGYVRFSRTGVYNFRGVFCTTGDNITGVAIGSNVIDYGTRTDQTYVYRHVPFISQNPTAVFDFDFYVGSTTNYYYIDLFAVDSPTLQATSNALGGTWLTIGPSTGGGGSGGSITISTLGNCILNTSPGASDYYIGVNNGSIITLPLGASLSAGKQYIIKDESGLAGTLVGYRVTVVASGSDSIDGQASLIIALNYGAVNVIWTGTKWSIF